MIASGITCEIDTVKIKAFFKKRAITFGWAEETLNFDDELSDTPVSEQERNAYSLKPVYHEVKDFVSNLDETKIVNLRFTKQNFTQETVRTIN